MSYREYVIAAYAVFAAMLAWDYLLPKLQLRAVLHAVRARERRALTAARGKPAAPAAPE